MNLIAFSGLPRSGKDTAADWLCMHGYTRMKFATPFKRAAAPLLGRTYEDIDGQNGFDRDAILPEWGFTTRDFLQRFGNEAMKGTFGEDFWVRHMLHTIAGLDRVVITDCRFENEAKMIRSLGGIVVGIDRPGLTASAHASDAGVVVDCVVTNDGTLPQFAEKIGKLMSEYHAAVARRAATEQQ
jgi:hypothetical protein